MQVQFTLEEEAQLARIAERSGTGAEQIVKDAARRLLTEDDQFRQGVQRGLAAAETGKFIDSEEVWVNLQAILKN